MYNLCTIRVQLVYKTCTFSVQKVYSLFFLCTKSVHLVYRKCTVSFFYVQKVYILCTESVQPIFFCVQKVYIECTESVQRHFFVYKRCTICVQQYIFLHFGMYKNAQRFLYKLVHCRKIQHIGLYIVLFFVTWSVHCTVAGCTFQTVHFTGKNIVQFMYKACTKSVQSENKVYNLCTMRVQKVYSLEE